MTPEEFQRIKEAEKAHLRKLKELKQAVQQARRQQKVTGAVQSIIGGMTDALDTHAESIEKLDLETAKGEARMEMALDAVADTDAARPPATAGFEEDLQKARARELIRQMKREAGQPDEASAVPPATKTIGRPAAEKPTTEGSESPAPPPMAPEPIPEKTIGRMKP